MVQRVPLTGGEKESLRVALDRHREVVLWKVEGLDEEQARRPMTPSGTSLLGLVKHLGSVEYGWFCETFGRESDAITFDEADPEADMRAEPHETTADVVGYYGRARAAADRVIEESALDDLGTGVDRRDRLDALGAHPHARGDRPARRPHGHPPRAHRRRRGRPQPRPAHPAPR